MPWWGWMVIGAILLGAELFVIEADFYLVFFGLSALLTGLGVLALPEVPPWSQWLIFAGLALISMLFFRKRVYRRLRATVPDMPDDLTGESVRVPQAVAPGESCRLDYRGTTWSARNEGSRPIAAGAAARVLGTHGITLRIESSE